MAKPPAQKLRLMLSSTVYGKEALLDQLYALLTGFGYKVWNSHRGTVPIIPHASTYDSCIAAVEQCDIFFGLITPEYGSGTDGDGGPSITHRELIRAIELDKPRLIVAHEQVVNARRLLLDLGYGKPEDRAKLILRKGASIITDLRLIDMYDAATKEHLPIPDRTGNWVQKYQKDSDLLTYVEEQFSRYADMEAFVAQQPKPGGAT